MSALPRGSTLLLSAALLAAPPATAAPDASAPDKPAAKASEKTPDKPASKPADKAAERAEKAFDETTRKPPPETTLLAPPVTDSGRGPARHTYKIRPGDTLWTVSQAFFRDPADWPKLWAMNPEILNPHWIFPGQIVRLRDSSESAKIAANSGGPLDDDDADDAAPSPMVARAPVRPMVRRRPAAPELRQLGFVDEGALKASGTINGSVEEKIMLASGDHAYVEFPAGKQPKGEARYSVYQVDRDHPVQEPGSKAVLGYLVHVYGEVVIDRPSEHAIASGHLVNLAGPVERGYRVGPLMQQRRPMAIKPNAVQLKAQIAASMDPNFLLGTETYVVLNRGHRHGVEPGNRFLILRQGDGLKDVLEDWDSSDPGFPEYAVAEILAVDVGESTTVGWISRGNRELHVGDTAELRRGY
ncbi:MAG TPA: LysM peptidoglycan-binding domain-containing protein [Polyangia bacterium]|nr:LysM peptidoglycan-binding domain-containing protein [Polyangia bacterium]